MPESRHVGLVEESENTFKPLGSRELQSFLRETAIQIFFIIFFQLFIVVSFGTPENIFIRYIM